MKRSSAFQAWFGSSQVVDAAGRPRVVYHGSRASWLDRFDLRQEGRGVVNPTGKRFGVVWFTSSRSNAQYYTDRRPKRSVASHLVYGEHGAFYAAAFDDRDNSLFSVGPWPSRDDAEQGFEAEAARYQRALRTDTFVLPVYLSLRNPLRLEGVIPRDAEFAAARAAGHDGVIAANVLDGSHVSDCFAVFSPGQVKHVRNEGAWSLTDTNLRC